MKEKIEKNKPIGTLELGSDDEVHDGKSTRRRRRKVIVIRQKRGTSL